MARVQIKAAKGDFQYLKELAHRFNSYLELFPPPLEEECVFELVPAKMEKRLFAWQWPNDTLTSKQDSWQSGQAVSPLQSEHVSQPKQKPSSHSEQ